MLAVRAADILYLLRIVKKHDHDHLQVRSSHFSQSVSKSVSESGQTVSYVFSHSGSQSVS